MFTKLRFLTCTALIAIQAAAPVRAEPHELAQELTMAISLMLVDPAISGHGVALENYEDERYNHSITVQYTGREGDSVEEQVRETAEVASRVGNLVLDRGLSQPGKHLIIKMALVKKDGWFITTFSVRYDWADLLNLAKSHAPISDLATKGKIESIWLEYWPAMCLNQPAPELFLGGHGDPETPEDIENPKGNDLSCRRRL